MTNPPKPWKTVTLNVTISALTSVISAIVLYNSIDLSFIENAECQSTKSWSYCFFDTGNVWSSETYTSLITNFYTTIITFLAIIISIISVVAFFVIRETARSHAEDHIEKEIKKLLTKDRLEMTLQSIMNDEMIRRAAGEILEQRITPLERKNEIISENLDEIRAALEEEGIEIKSDRLGA